MHPLAKETKKVVAFLTDATPVDELPKVDAIFAFGHTSSRIPEHAAKLYKRGLAPFVIVTGHKGSRASLPGGFETQAEFFGSVLNGNGVPRSVIISEKKSLNTLENVLFGMIEADRVGLEIKSLILCALPAHLRRCRSTFSKQFPHIATYGSAFAWDENEWLTDYRIGRLVGEVDRLVKYAEKGDTVPVTIPDEVKLACETISSQVPVI